MTRMAGGRFRLAACALAVAFAGPVCIALTDAQPAIASSGNLAQANPQAGLLAALGPFLSPLDAGCSEAPAIQQQPTNQTVTAPATAEFSASASTPASCESPTVQWYSEAPGASTPSPITGATFDSYTTPATTAEESGTKLEAVFKNEFGETTTEVVTLTVNAPACAEAPSIAEQPSSQTVTAPGTATFTASGSTPTNCGAPTVQWFSKPPGGSISAIPGATSDSYTTPSTNTSQNGTKLEAVFKNEFGETTTEVVTLTVNAPACAEAPSIAEQPSSQTVTAPGTATFTASGSTPTNCGAPTVQWFSKPPGGSISAIPGATSDSYTTPSTNTSQNGTKLEAVFKNEFGETTTEVVTLTVNAPACAEAPSIAEQPSSQTVTAPGTATFTASGSTPANCGAPSVQWYDEPPGSSSFSAIGGATSGSYTTPATNTGENGTKFEAVFTNGAGSITSNAATLTVEAPPCAATPVIEMQPGNASVTEPATATFSASASTPANCAAPTVQWYAEAPGAGTFTLIGGATSGSYTTPATTTAESGTKFVAAFANSAGPTLTHEVTLTVKAPPCSTPPAVETQPTGAVVTAPGTATFTASGSTPANCGAPSVQWYDEPPGSSSFSAIGGATSGSYTTPATNTGENGTKFEAVFTNGAGSIASNAVTLTVEAPACATTPVIETQPGNATVTEPATATFTASASTPTNCAAPTVQWYSEAPGAGTFTVIGGATSASYTTPATTTAESGTKFVAAFANSAGPTLTHEVTLTVKAPPCSTPPAVETQPTGAVVTAPGTATFTASGSTPANCGAPTVQWYDEPPGGFSFSAIGGATSGSYTTPPTNTGENGTEFEAVFTNSAGSTPSSAVTLTVNAPPCTTTPVIETQPGNASVTEPATATFTASASTPSNCAAPTVQWYSEAPGAGTFTVIGGATSSSYTTPATTTAESGTKFVAAFANSAGPTLTHEVTLTVKAPPCSTPPAVETQPTGAVVTAPGTATFTASGSTPANCGAPTVQWYDEPPGSSSFSAIGGATSGSYTTPATNTGENGTKFEAVFTNGAGSIASNAATLTVNAPPCTSTPAIETQPGNASVTEPATATFTASASTPTNCAAPTVQWYSEAPGAGTFTPIGGATSSSYTTPATTTAESGTKYVAAFANSAGPTLTHEVTLTVKAPPCSSAPAIETQPGNATVTEPATATFTASASTPAHCTAPTVQWYDEPPGSSSFSAIGGATSGSYTTGATNTGESGTKFKAVFTNASGPATTAEATLTINPPPCSTIPTILVQPTARTVTSPATATFTSSASTPANCAAPTVQWYSEAPGASVFVPITGATSGSYTTPATTTAESGTNYEAVFTNGAGPSFSSIVTLTVNAPPCSGPPKIETQPTSQTVTAPATATFTAAASTPLNCAAPTVQWRTKAPGGAVVEIAGATSDSYTTPPTTVAQSGTLFEAVFTNAAGEQTTEIVTLTVKPPPPTVSSITPTPGPSVGGATVHIVGSSFVAPAKVKIGSEAVAVDVVSATEITATTAATTAGTYEVIVTDANGTSTLGPSYTYVAPPIVTMEAPAKKSNDPTPSFKGTATDTTPVIVEIYKGSTATGSPVASATAPAPGAGGAWSSAGATPELLSGQYTAVAVQESSVNGNPAGKSEPFKFTVDTEAPSVSLDAPPPWTNDPTPSFSGSAAEKTKPVTIHIYNPEGTEVATATVAGTGGPWTSGPVSPGLPDGSYTVVVSQPSSLPGNHTGETTPVPFAVDTVAPDVTLTSPANGSSAASTSRTVSGVAGFARGDVPRVRAQLFLGSGVNQGAVVQESAVNTSGATWAATFAGLHPGETYTARAEQVDKAGNVGKSAAESRSRSPRGLLRRPPRLRRRPHRSRGSPLLPTRANSVSLASSSTDATDADHGVCLGPLGQRRVCDGRSGDQDDVLDSG